jgi:hypothetical protein
MLLYLSLAKLNLRSRPQIFLRRLLTIERRVRDALELLLNPQDPKGIGQIRQAMLTCGVKEYTFLSRKESLVFVNSVTCGHSSPPDQITVSPMLLEFLAKRKHVIDLEQLAYEWHLFFLQFELERLRLERPAKYLIPIKLGESLRGLLIISNAADERVLAGEHVAGGISDIALVTTQLRYQHSIPSTKD